MNDLGTERRARLRTARLYLVCGGMPGERELADLMRAAIRGGMDVVQLREKGLDEGELRLRAEIARELCELTGALFIVNDRPDIARDVGADGVHVGQEDMAVADARAIVGEEMLIGLSTHTRAEIDAAGIAAGAAEALRATGAQGARADYIGVGPVHATPTKPGRQAVGLELVRYAAAHARLPFFAIGGLDPGNVDAALEAGARRVCVLRAIAQAEDPGEAARALRARIDAAWKADAAPKFFLHAVDA